MQQVANQLVSILRQVLQVFIWIWDWSGGQVIKAFELLSRFDSLPIWKRVLMVVVAISLAYLIFLIATDIWAALRRIFEAIFSLIRTLFDNILYVAFAGVLAFGGAWAINNLTIAWLP